MTKNNTGTSKWLKYPKVNKSIQNPNLSKIEPKMAKLTLKLNLQNNQNIQFDWNINKTTKIITPPPSRKKHQMTKILNLQNVVWCFLMSSFGHWTYTTIIGVHYTIHIVCVCVFLCSYTHHIVCLFSDPLKLLSLSLSLSLYIYIFLPSLPTKHIHFFKYIIQ